MNQQQKELLPKGPFVYTKLTEHTGVIRAANNVTILKTTSNLSQRFKDGSRFLAPNMDALAALIVQALNAFWVTGMSPREFMKMFKIQSIEDQEEIEIYDELPE